MIVLVLVHSCISTHGIAQQRCWSRAAAGAREAAAAAARLSPPRQRAAGTRGRCAPLKRRRRTPVNARHFSNENANNTITLKIIAIPTQCMGTSVVH